MKIPTWVEFESREVEVEVAPADIVSALMSLPGNGVTQPSVLRALNILGGVCRAFTDEQIASLEPQHKAVIEKFFVEQAGRYK